MTDHPMFSVERIEELTFTGPDLLTTHDLMSPFVWRQDDGRCGLLLRVVEDSSNDEGGTGSIWYGAGDDGLHFSMDDAPVLAPGAEGYDCKGCEDPTLVRHGEELIVFYSGVDAHGDSHLLWASGTDIRSLTKRGVAHGSSPDLQNVKEAEVVLAPEGKWIMGFEFADGESSRIGYADGDGPTGPWHKTKQGFGPRDDRFDSWHLSPGPMILADPDHPVMFYNGATREAVWSVGWIVFDVPNDRVLDRCEGPLVVSPAEQDGRNMAFAASLVEHDDAFSVYVSFNDQSCHRVILQRASGADDQTTQGDAS